MILICVCVCVYVCSLIVSWAVSSLRRFSVRHKLNKLLCSRNSSHCNHRWHSSLICFTTQSAVLLLSNVYILRLHTFLLTHRLYFLVNVLHLCCAAAVAVVAAAAADDDDDDGAVCSYVTRSRSSRDVMIRSVSWVDWLRGHVTMTLQCTNYAIISSVLAAHQLD